MDSNGTRWDRVDRPYKREERRVRSPRLTSVRMLLWCFASPLPLWYLVLLASTSYSIPFLPRYPQGRPFIHIFFTRKEEILTDSKQNEGKHLESFSSQTCILGLIFYR